MFTQTHADRIRKSLQYLRELNARPTTSDIQAVLRDFPNFVDVCPILLGKEEERLAQTVCDELGEKLITWSRLQGLATENPARVAQALATIGLPEAMAEHFHPRMELEDVLTERYKTTCEDRIGSEEDVELLLGEVQQILRDHEIPFQRMVTFIGRDARTADCDFAVPSKQHPKIVIDVKPFEVLRWKLPEYFEEALGTAAAKVGYFFLLTDGMGWHNRKNDLQKFVKLQNYGVIDMIYTRARLAQLAHDVKHIHENE